MIGVIDDVVWMYRLCCGIFLVVVLCVVYVGIGIVSGVGAWMAMRRL